MPGQRAAGQQQKTHCPLVYTQPHPSPRPGPGPFLLSTRPPPLPLSSPFLPLLKQIAHICIWSGRKAQAKRHLCCTVAGGLIGWTMGNLGQICKPCAALHHDECNVLDYTFTVMWLSWEGMLINVLACRRERGCVWQGSVASCSRMWSLLICKYHTGDGGRLSCLRLQ